MYVAIHGLNIHLMSNKARTMPTDTAPSPGPALLGLLMAGPRHGYELHRDFRAGLGRVWQIGLSQLYAQLKRLAEAGLVTVETEAQPSRPPRKVYRLTPAGREAFLAWLQRPTPHVRGIRLEFLARLYFYRELGLPGLEALVAGQAVLFRQRAAALAESAAASDDEFLRLVYEFRRMQLAAVIAWLERCLEAP